MENDRRKKKNNKRKKNKQATTLTESVTNDGRESTSDPRNHVVEMEQDMDVQFSGATDASIDVGLKMDSDMDGHLSSGIEEQIPMLHDHYDPTSSRKKNTNIANLAKADKQYWIDREASFEEKFKQLQAEKDAQMQKEAILEDKIKELLKEKDENLQKLASQEETIRQLHSAKISFIQKEDTLEERIKQLQREKDAYLQKEFSTEESIAALSNDRENLRAQVTELEESRKCLLKEKQELTEKVSILQLQINNLESTISYPHSNMNNKVTSDDGNMDCQREVMHAPGEKLVPENPELVEKVNGMRADSLSVGSNPGDVAALSAGVADSSALTQDFAVGAEARKMMPVSHSTRPLEEVMINFENGEDVNGGDSSGPPKSSEDIVEDDEIVQIPLGENRLEDTRLVVYEKNDVSLTEAPLIGAPFRFISFVARYVSGADLVDKNSKNSG